MQEDLDIKGCRMVWNELWPPFETVVLNLHHNNLAANSLVSYVRSAAVVSSLTSVALANCFKFRGRPVLIHTPDAHGHSNGVFIASGLVKSAAEQCASGIQGPLSDHVHFRHS